MMMRNPILATMCAAAIAMTPGLASAQQADVDANSDFVGNVSGHDVLRTANLDAAIDALKEECRKSDNDPALLINLGQAYARAGDFVRAEQSFLKAHNSRKRYDIMLANGEVMSTRAAAKEALTWLGNVQAGTVIARN
jgi:Flp pilus assembly protein TadD